MTISCFHAQPETTTRNSGSVDQLQLQERLADTPFKFIRSRFSYWDEIGVVALLLAALLFFQRLRQNADDDAVDAEFLEPQLSDANGRLLHVGGIPVAIESFDDTSTTIWIRLKRKPVEALEVNARAGFVEAVDARRRASVESLLELGVTYIDIGCTSPRLAAEMAKLPADIDDEVIPDIVDALLSLLAHSRPRH